MNNVRHGKVVKGIGGFYYVLSDGETFECKASGLFRKNNITPLVGDRVDFDDLGDLKGYITGIKERKNFLVRPPVANIDLLFIVSSANCPAPNLLNVDKLTAIAENKNIEPVIVFNKSDLEDLSGYVELYKSCGFNALSVSCVTGEGTEELKALQKDKISAFCGNSGVGKSSILNYLDSRLDLKTGEISKKLGRGRHTTRHTELFEIGHNTYIADSPGFSSLDMDKSDLLLKDELAYLFREFRSFIADCRFTSCSHTKEKGCGVIKAVEEGFISKSRHNSYVTMFEEAKKIKEWEIK